MANKILNSQSKFSWVNLLVGLIAVLCSFFSILFFLGFIFSVGIGGGISNGLFSLLFIFLALLVFYVPLGLCLGMGTYIGLIKSQRIAFLVGLGAFVAIMLSGIMLFRPGSLNNLRVTDLVPFSLLVIVPGFYFWLSKLVISRVIRYKNNRL